MTEDTITVDLRVDGKLLIVEDVPQKFAIAVVKKLLAPPLPKNFRIWLSGKENHHELDEFLYSPWKKAPPEKSFHHGAEGLQRSKSFLLKSSVFPNPNAAQLCWPERFRAIGFAHDARFLLAIALTLAAPKKIAPNIRED